MLTLVLIATVITTYFVYTFGSDEAEAVRVSADQRDRRPSK